MTDCKPFTIDIERVKRVNMDKAHGYWFSPGARRFFDSHHSSTAVQIGTKAYFVSSEQFHHDGHSQPRGYTVRVCNMTTGDIDAVGAFQHYDSSAQARAAIKKIVKEAS